MTQNTETQAATDDDLVKRGYADGKYICSCRKCGGSFMGDKRAWCCKGCAMSSDRITALLAERDAARAEAARLERAVALLRRADMQVAWESLGLGNAFAEEVESALANTTTSNPLTKTWNEAIEAVASMFTSNDAKLIRHRIRKLKKGD